MYKLACEPIEDSDPAHLQSDQSLMSAAWVAKGPKFLQADN